MPSDLKERPQSNEYDENWKPDSSSDNVLEDDLESSRNDDNSGNDSDNPSSKAESKKSLDGDELKNAEANAGGTAASIGATALGSESAIGGMSGKLGKGFTGTGLVSGKKKKGVYGIIIGATITILIIAGSMLFPSFELIHVRQSLLGN